MNFHDPALSSVLQHSASPMLQTLSQEIHCHKHERTRALKSECTFIMTFFRKCQISFICEPLRTGLYKAILGPLTISVDVVHCRDVGCFLVLCGRDFLVVIGLTGLIGPGTFRHDKVRICCIKDLLLDGEHSSTTQ